MEQRHCNAKILNVFLGIYTAFYIAFFISLVVYLFLHRCIDGGSMQLMVLSGLFLSVVYVVIILGFLRVFMQNRCLEVDKDASRKNVNPEIMKKEIKTLIKECLSEVETVKKLAQEASNEDADNPAPEHGSSVAPTEK